ncbi:MAG: phosphate signaling complex protein PhoU [Marinicaulis sp.]|nr:phosphate signaling complex protein PhoU [Marinicaulis sp.]
MLAQGYDNIVVERRSLENELARMAASVESQLQGAVTAFERRDIVAAERLIEGDARIDEYFSDIEAKVINLLAAGKLADGDLRKVVSIMKVNGELERVGDLAKNIAKRTLVVSREKSASPNVGVARMGRASVLQFADILNAYASRNLDAAKAVWRGDDELDELYNSVFREIINKLVSDPNLANAFIHLVFIAKNFERVGDHATNIAEAIHFELTGQPMPDLRPKSDNTAAATVDAGLLD